jgi:hypothetical protein
MAPPRLTPEQKAANKQAREQANKQARADGRPTEIEKINQQAIIHPEQVRSEGLVSRARDVVVVACKVGVSYIDLRLMSPRKVMEQTQTGAREVTEWKPTGEAVRIRGTSYPRGTPPAGFPERPRIAHGFALTPKISRNFWAQWIEQNEKNPLVQNHLIFAGDDLAEVTAMAAEHAGQLSGLEPIDPRRGADPRVPKPVNASLTPIETEESRAANQRNVESVADSFDDAEV